MIRKKLTLVPYQDVTDLELLHCCQTVDRIINDATQSDAGGQRRSNSVRDLLRGNYFVRKAARSLLLFQQKSGIDLNNYIHAAVTWAILRCRRPIQIKKLATQAVFDEIQARSTKDTPDTKQRVVSDISKYTSSAPSLLAARKHGADGSRISIFRSLQRIMANHDVVRSLGMLEYLIANRTWIDPVVLYSIQEIRDRIDQEELALNGYTVSDLVVAYTEYILKSDALDSLAWESFIATCTYHKLDCVARARMKANTAKSPKSHT